MWIVAVDTDYYPFVVDFNTYEEAKEYYNKQLENSFAKVYLAEVGECSDNW